MSRVSYRNYPVLKIINDINLRELNTAYGDEKDFDKFTPEFVSHTSFFLKNCDKKINIVNKTFIEKINHCLKSLQKIAIEEIIKDEIIFIVGNIVCLFFVNSDPKNKELTSYMSVLSKKGTILCYGIVCENKIYPFVSKSYDFNFNQLWATAFNIIILKKYAPVEIIESKAKTKTNQFGCKYLNETDFDIEHLDSKWFTTLIKSNGFKVGGHFRLQPKKKDGYWTKELIWINDFEKKGYNRKATILNKIP